VNSLSGKTILVVDDEEMLREILAEELMGRGATVFCAENGASALSLVRQRKFDAVISDVRMPGGDGISLIKSIREELLVKPKVFLCSGFNDLSKEDARDMGVIEIFGKPFKCDLIVRSVAKALGNASL
jgi:DNA-binding NtrC family response regulator